MFLERIVYSVLCTFFVIYIARKCVKVKSNWNIGLLRISNNWVGGRSFNFY